nr:LuxR C-terminal-related transcriptional regulator [Kibdelosporangium sp. MJ126-NF4]CEL14155.1 large transcriptional regulator [Kibdelosporangium sp. MJ126-NF4]CTQ88522.1 large transcriptional regulator [Kibdelosporangium sp. MJ126-NF4]
MRTTDDDRPLLTDVRAALARTPVVVLVSGAAGMGKTWLAAQVLATAQHAVRVVVDCRGLPDEPHVVVRELVRGLVQAGGPATRADDVLTAADAATTRGTPDYRTCAALRELLAATAAHRGSPVLVVVDDVDLADRWSRHVLRCCASRPPDAAALLLTYTPGSKHPLWTRWGSAVLHRFELRPLSVQEVASRCPSDQAAAVHHLTGGIPLFVAEVVTHLRPGYRDPYEAVLRRGVPQAVVDLVAERACALPTPARRLVTAASVLRGPFIADIPAEMCRVAPDRARVLLAHAVDAGLLALRGAGAFEFSPPLIGLAVAHTTPAVERRQLHAKVARVLDRRGEQPGELVHHSRAAGDLASAARHAEKAAERAVRSGEAEAAVELLRTLLADSDLPRRVRASLAGQLGRLALDSLAYDETIALLRALVADDLLPDGVRGELRLHLGLLVGNQAGDGDEQRGHLVVAVRELRRRPLLAARAMSALAMPYWGSCHVDEHLAWLARLDQTLPQGGDPALRMAIRVNRASTLLQIGDPQAWTAIAALPDGPVSTGERHELARGYSNFMDTAISLGHHASAEEFHGKAEKLTGRTRPSYLHHMIISNRLRLAAATGQWTGIEPAAREHLSASAQTPFAAADASLVLGHLALARGEWAEAEEFLRAPGLRANNGWCSHVVVAAAATRVRLALARGRADDALSELTRALDVIRAKGIWSWAAELADAGVRALLHVGDIMRAEHLADEFTADISTRDCPFGHAMVPGCRGAIAAERGQFADAAKMHTESAALLGALPRPYEQAAATEAAARCLLAAGKPEAAEQLSEASRLFASLGATWDAARCDRLAREHGGTPGSPRGRRGYGAELSPREQDVARLMVLGRTNRQIAEVLFLSPRTVERHAARVLHKLGVASREEISHLP